VLRINQLQQLSVGQACVTEGVNADIENDGIRDILPVDNDVFDASTPR
jgi:hypothetical protein